MDGKNLWRNLVFLFDYCPYICQDYYGCQVLYLGKIERRWRMSPDFEFQKEQQEAKKVLVRLVELFSSMRPPNNRRTLVEILQEQAQMVEKEMGAKKDDSE